MTAYRAVTSLQEPSDLGILDDAGRVQVEFNILAWKRPSDTWLEELVAILVAANIDATKIRAGAKATIPREGAYLSVRPTGGTSPLGTHNESASAWDRRPGAQIIARAESWADAYELAQAAYSALVAVRNTDVQVA